MNFTAVFALLFGIILVFLSQKYDGGSLNMLIQPTAFCIVIGGSFCAVLLNFNLNTVLNAFSNIKYVFVKTKDKSSNIISEILQMAYFARRNSVFELQDVIKNISEPFLARGIQLAIDVENPSLVHDILSAEISYEEEEELIASRVFEALGGYAPTFGVIGAVMGLIRVMQDIQNLEIVGVGIATAFVATLYGVGFANLVFLPIAGNLKQKTREKILLKEIVLQGIISIQMRENPALIEEKLIGYLKFHDKYNAVEDYAQ
ncbi:MotA/TolQ/ExbB proton channel family protein [bacterium]|nr:MotA/TolQ/ExbB proton channel family protein [bacterium]